jgi:hypothetical protein
VVRRAMVRVAAAPMPASRQSKPLLVTATTIVEGAGTGLADAFRSRL